ncbi:MAG: hypothetical protein Q9190_003015 [Brigantiaea leucoxantha]
MPSPTQGSDPEALDLAQAFQELARGEQTASVMEKQLTTLEQKIDDLLATAESQNARSQSIQSGKAPTGAENRVTGQR